jgi:RNA polymerase sigma factor (sigma-70 family)
LIHLVWPMDLMAASSDVSQCTEILQHTLEDSQTTSRLLTQIIVLLRKAGVRHLAECREHARDLAQNAIAQALRHQDRYDARRGDPGGWLYGIAVNVVRDFIRKQRRLPIQWPVHDKSFEYLLQHDTSYDELPSLIDMVDILDQFNSADQNLIQLYFLEQRSHHEIAEMLQIKVGTLRTRLTRLRRHLRDVGRRTLLENAS